MQLDRRALFAPGILCLLLGLVDCASSDSAEATSDTFDSGTPRMDSGTPPPSDVSVDTAPPPEREVESSYKSPVATGRYVWVANPKSGRVAYVDATSLDVKVVEAGNGPT